jgi:hypothetical protein
VGIQQSGFNGQKRNKMNAIAIWHDGAEIWLGVGLVNGDGERSCRCFGGSAVCPPSPNLCAMHSVDRAPRREKAKVRKLSFAPKHLFS